MKEKEQLITTPVFVNLQIPQEQLKPTPSIVSRWFGKRQKNEALYKWLPKSLYYLLHRFSATDVHCIASHTTQWITSGFPYQVTHKKGQKTNEYICEVSHFDHQEKLIWKTLYRWWLQDNAVHFAVFVQGSFLTFDIVLSELVASFPELKMFFARYGLQFYQTSLNNRRGLFLSFN